MASLKRLRTRAVGALPGRNPGRRTDEAYRRAVCSSASCTVSADTDTSSSRSTPSLFLVLISMFIVHGKLMDHQQARLAKSGIRQHHAPFAELPQFPPFLQQGIPPMRVGRLLALAAVVVALSACHHQVIQTGRTPGSTVVHKPWTSTWILGLVPAKPLDVTSACPSGVATIETQHSVANVIVTAFTGIVWVPIDI